MSEDKHSQDLSLDAIFSRLRKEKEGKRQDVCVPFKFLDSYTLEDRNIFFGREKEIEEIFRMLYSGKLILVYGRSGTGKSSIVNCGLLSRIPREDIFSINIRCGRKAHGNFISGIKKFASHGTSNGSSDAVEILEDIFFEQSKPITLILDQFEEIFVLSNKNERQKLVADLSQILKSRLKINIVLVIREEFFANLTEFEPDIPSLYDHRIRIERMSRSSALKVITEPCRVCEVGIEDGLPEKILDQLAIQSEGLELTWLQILMDKLYRVAVERDEKKPVIKHEDLETLGRMGNVLSDFLDEQLQSMSNGELGEAVLKTMISPDGTKKQVSLEEISESLKVIGHPLGKKQINEILQYFVRVRIITDQDEEGLLELRHDAIAFRIFERMTALEKELVEIRSFLDNSYTTYQKRKVLLTGSDLKYIALYENRLILSDELKEFIRLSKREVQKSRTRRRSIAIAAVGALVIILTGFTIWAFYERNKAIDQSNFAEVQKNEALRANEETEKARTQALKDRDRAEESEAVAIEHQKIAEEEGEKALRANRATEAARQQALEERNRAIENEKIAEDARIASDKAREETTRANNEASFYLYLFNGKELANKSLDMKQDRGLRARLALTAYELVGHAYRHFSQDEMALQYDYEILQALQEAYLEFEDDKLIDGEIWDMASGKEGIAYSNTIGKLFISKLDTRDQGKRPELTTTSEINLPGMSFVQSVAFNDSGDQLACGMVDGNVVHVDLSASGSPVPTALYNHAQKRVWNLAFVPGRDWIVSSAADRTFKVWDLYQQRLIRELQLDENIKEFVVVNSGLLVFPLSDGRLMGWDPGSEQAPETLFVREDNKPFQSIAYNHEHDLLVASSLGDIKIIPLHTLLSQEMADNVLTIENVGVTSQLEFSPDNNWLVSAGTNAIMLWDLRDEANRTAENTKPLVIENEQLILSLAFDQQSKFVLFGDHRQMRFRPLSIADIYSNLKLISGGGSLSSHEWNYFIKGNLERPDQE